jgi:hypothetical protein
LRGLLDVDRASEAQVQSNGIQSESSSVATVASVVVVDVAMIVAGIAEVINALQARKDNPSA